MHTKIEMAVEMTSACCAEKVTKVLADFKGITSSSVDWQKQRVVIEGHVIAENVRNAIEDKSGMSSVILGLGSGEYNLGAGVAAVKFGNHGILGLLRFIQQTPQTCAFEGTLDNLPWTNEPLFMTVHESGDVSAGCNSCGSLLTTEKGFNGFISQLIPDKEKQAEFQVTNSAVELSELIGRCVCVHKGSVEDVKQDKSERLACGIVARASGLFQNSKRFCACDGVTIWEQRKGDRHLADRRIKDI